MNKKGFAVLLSAILVISAMSVTVSSAQEQEIFWQGDVILAEGVFDITAHNSGETYTMNRTTALGALDAAAAKGGFSYTVDDTWYLSLGSLYMDSIAEWTAGTKGWMYWVNYPSDPMPMVGANLYDIENGDVVSWYYGGWRYEDGEWKSDTPDTAPVLINISVAIPASVSSVIIKPETLNLSSQGMFTASIQLPEGYSVTDINVCTVECEGAPAVRGMVASDTFIAKFNRHDLVNVITGDAVTLMVTGELYDSTPFGGTDTVRVIE